MGKIPGITKPKFYEKKAVIEGFSIVPPIITASVAAAVNFADPKKQYAGWIMVGGIVWLVIASIVKVLNAKAQDKEQRSKQDYDGLLGAMHVLYGQISGYVGFSGTDRGRLRVTIHRVVPSLDGQTSEELEQLLPYIGGDGRPSGRRFSIRSGIIGKAVREKTPYASFRENDNHEAFIKELVANWSYTEHDARQVTSDRQAWMAIPIFGSPPSASGVVAVVYLDSDQRNFFSKQVQKLALHAASGIATYIDERYA